MTKEEKDLLLNDLCARSPYGVKCKSKYFTNDTLSGVIIDGEETVFNFSVNNEGFIIQLYISGIKPYLFPLSSMTEEQKEEYRKVCELDTEILSKHPMDGSPFPALYNSQDWLNKNHFDYRGLIEKGLAIDATGKNIY